MNFRMKIALVCGLSGSGKTTFCQEAAADLGQNAKVKMILVGEKLRKAAKEDESIARLVKTGKKVPDSFIINQIVGDFDEEAINLLDNYPQSIGSIKNLDGVINSRNVIPTYLIIEMKRAQCISGLETREFLKNRNNDYINTVVPMIQYLRMKKILYLECTGYKNEFFGEALTSKENYTALDQAL